MFDDTLGNITYAENGVNNYLWFTPGLAGNYSIFCYANDTTNLLGTSTETWVNFVTTTTGTTTTTT